MAHAERSEKVVMSSRYCVCVYVYVCVCVGGGGGGGGGHYAFYNVPKVYAGKFLS